MEAISVRRLLPADLVHYKALRDAMLAAHPEAFTSDALAERSRSPDSYLSRFGVERHDGGEFTLGAWQGEQRLVGAISCERDLRVKVRHIAHIVGMMVRDKSRGRGVGRTLLDECIAQARRVEELRMITLSVTGGNAHAIRLYDRAGFVRYGTLPSAIVVDGRPHAKELMVLTL
jgi:ribosomal protein S18 acetylase RimI-like enzyme